MSDEIKELTDIKILFEYYYKHKNLEKYAIVINPNRIIVDDECLDILTDPNERLYITPFKKYKQLKEENQKLKKDYERIYNENYKLREWHNITDISLLDENEKLNKIIDELERWLKERINRYEYSTGNMNIAATGTLKATLNKLTELKNEVE